jgi:hypothetical protein
MTSAIEELRMRTLGFLNAHAAELGEIALQAIAARTQQKTADGVKYDRRVLSELFMASIVNGTAKRRELGSGDADAFATQAIEFADALIRANGPPADPV